MSAEIKDNSISGEWLTILKPKLERLGIKPYHLQGIIGAKTAKTAVNNLGLLLTAAESNDRKCRRLALVLIERYKETFIRGAGGFDNLGEIPEDYFQRDREGIPIFISLIEKAGLAVFERYGHEDCLGLPSKRLTWDPGQLSSFALFVLPRLKDGGRDFKFLDAGCGRGQAIKEVAGINNKIECVGVDLFPYYQNWQKIKTENPLVNFTIGNLLDPPFDKETFDIIYSKNTLMYPLDKFAFVVSLLRLLKIGGLLYLDFASDGKTAGEDYYFYPSLFLLLDDSKIGETIEVFSVAGEERPYVFLFKKLLPTAEDFKKPRLHLVKPASSTSSFATRSCYDLAIFN